MTLSDLLRKAETSADKATWLIRYYSRFGYAATNFTLVLLGLPVIVFFASRNLIFGAILALGIATAYFVVNSICQDLGIQGRIPASLAAGFAPILFIALGATLYRGMRS
jgi:lipopolysaccharide export LptBFGC system permease protein LptF